MLKKLMFSFLLPGLYSITVLFSGEVYADNTLTVMSWNVESGRADPTVIAEQIKAFKGVDIWGISEVQNEKWAQMFEQAAEDSEGIDFKSILGTMGGTNRLLILYRSDRFDRVERRQLDYISLGNNWIRPPLIAHLRDTTTGKRFLFMVNHFMRWERMVRQIQSRLLNEWGREQTLPVIAVGDFNFDWRIEKEKGNRSFNYFMKDDVYRWVRPQDMVRTICSKQRDYDFNQNDLEEKVCRHNAVLDFVFVSGPAKDWEATSQVVVREGDFPDSDQTSDHRPVKGTFKLPD
ncbi:MAG: endonuclease/exonuclease/phosphatase family protein [Candidatus Dadabacteria bacterium]|nr:endonuclease/exonuclease/phosphatase family protein [Candidatus Dadabacteria bacterium]